MCRANGAGATTRRSYLVPAPMTQEALLFGGTGFCVPCTLKPEDGGQIVMGGA